MGPFSYEAYSELQPGIVVKIVDKELFLGGEHLTDGKTYYVKIYQGTYYIVNDAGQELAIYPEDHGYVIIE